MQTIKLGRLQRAASFDRAAADEEARTVPLSFSSEAPVERWFGYEVLGHKAEEVDLAWMRGGTAPLLVDHNPTNQVGVVDGVELGADRKGRAVVRFGKSARAEQEYRDVLDGVRANVSVGYEILELELVSQEKGQPDTYRATRWRPLELSIVAVPADLTVGVGRAADGAAVVDVPVRSSLPLPPIKEAKTMNVTTVADPAPSPAPVDHAAARREELERMRGITYLGQRHQLGQLADKAITDGMSLADFRGLALAELEKRGSNKPLEVSAAQLGLSPSEVKRYSLLRAIRAKADNNWSQAGFEFECHQALERQVGAAKHGFYVPLEAQQRQLPVAGKRDLTVGTASAGGYLVATENAASSFIEMLRARTVLSGLGAVTLDGLVGNVNIPKQAAGGTAYWLANEATAITESQPTIGQVALTPRTVGGYTELSRLLLMQSSPSAEGLVNNDLARVLGLGIDLAGINGSGASGQPLGIIGTAGIGTVTGTTIAYAGIVEFQTDVANANALVGSAAYLTTPTVAGLLMQRQRFSSTDTPLWTGSVLDGLMAGFKATTTTQVPAANMLFGDFGQLVIANWGVLEIEANPYAGFTTGIVGVRAFATVDIGVRQAAAFSLATGIT